MGKIRSLFLLLFLLICNVSFGQSKYVVFYKYKPQESFSINQPQDYLSTAALLRRQKEGINIDSLDLPVSPKYVTKINSLVQEVIYSLKWLNASVVITNEQEVQELLKLDFVSKVQIISPESNNAFQRLKTNQKFGDIEGLILQDAFKIQSYKLQNELLGIQKMHEKGFTGKGIKIAIFDAGFPGVDKIKAFQHLFSDQRIIATKDFVRTNNSNVFLDNQHGTNVLSLVASYDPDLLIAGAHQAQLILCITEDVRSEYKIEEYNWTKAAEFADSLGVDIIQSSLGYWDFDDPSMDYTLKDLDGKTAIVSQAATIASSKGILVVQSAGNYGSRGNSSITPPADAKNILSVGALTPSLALSTFSSKGPTFDMRIKPELVSIGSGVFLIRSNGQLLTGNGTSFSAPQITALAAGIWEAMPNLKMRELIDVLLKSASNTQNPNNEIGYGIPNFEKVSAYLATKEKEEREIFHKIYPNPVTGNSEIFIDYLDGLEISIQLLDTRGVVIYKEVSKRNSIKEPFYITLKNVPSGVYWLESKIGVETIRRRLIKN